MSNIILDNNQMINSMHNDIQCIESLDPKDKGTSRQFWFSANMLAEIFGISRQAVNKNVEFLKKWKEIQSAKNFADWKMTYDNSNLTRDVTLYDLTVFNKLAMQLRTDSAMEIRSKFSDILVEVETTGQYNVQEQKPSYAIEDKIKRAQAWIEEQKYMLQLEEEKEKLELACSTLTQERDQAIKTKAQIGSKREATIMGKLGVQSKKIVKLEDDLTKANDNVNALQNELDRTLSTMFTTKRVCEILRAKFDLKYAESTLNQKVSKVLKSLSDELNERVVPQYTVVGEITRTRYFYTDRTVEELLQRLSNDSDYLKSVR